MEASQEVKPDGRTDPSASTTRVDPVRSEPPTSDFLAKWLPLGKRVKPREEPIAPVPIDKSPAAAVPEGPRVRKEKHRRAPVPEPASPSSPALASPPPTAPDLEVEGKGTIGDYNHKVAAVRKPRFVLERVYTDRVEALDFIDEHRPTPLYRDGESKHGEGKRGRHRELATLQTTPMGVELTPKDSLDGVYVRIKSSRRLLNGTRFRVGNYTIEARLPQPLASIGSREEPFHAKDLEAKGKLVFLRRDGSDGLSFPLLKKVLIGRGGPGDKPVDIPLLDDNVSRVHASVTPVEGGLKLKDLDSTNGTFIQITNPSYLDHGDSFRLGEMVLRLVSYPRTSV